MLRRVIVAVLSFVVASAAVLMAQASDRLPAQAVKSGFFRTVFGLEYGAHADAHRVKRFVGPVRFHVSDRSGFSRGAAAEAFVRALPKRIHFLRAGLVAQPAEANFRLIIVRRADFAGVVERELKADALAMNARCLVGVVTDRGRIVQSVAVIIGDDDYLFERCLVEETLQGLGPMNDDPSLYASVFNDTSRHTTFTAFDAALLNVLYHPAIAPGMSRIEAARALPAALRDLGHR
ncbi:MAG: DUF2927 domain-containing protein [Pseudomonadota bacterium]